MNFTRTTSYSIHVLSYMARYDPARMSVSHLHTQLKIPYSYLRTIMGNLTRSHLVDSIKGRNGGFRLGKDKTEIFMADIIEATEGLDSLNKCLMGFRECPFNQQCYIHPVWMKMKEEILSILKKTSLADLLIKIE